MRIPLRLAVGLVLVVGCGKKGPSNEQLDAEQKQVLAPIIEKYRAATTKQLAAFRAVGTDAKAGPPATAREPLTEEVKVDSKTLAYGTPWWFAGDPEPKDTGSRLTSNPRMSDRLTVMLETGLWNSGGGGYPEARSVEREFASVTAFRYAAVVRVRKYTEGHAGEDRFEGASATGDVLIYSLPAGKRVGAFPFETVQKLDRLSVGKGESANEELEKSFRGELSRTIEKELEAYASGSAGAAEPGMAAQAETDKFAKKLSSELLEWTSANQIMGIPQVTIEPGPIVIIRTDNPAAFEEQRATLMPLVEQTLGTKAEVRIERL